MVSWRVYAWQRLSLTLTWAHRAWNLHNQRNLRDGVYESAEIRAANLRMIVYLIQRVLSEPEEVHLTASDEGSEASDSSQSSGGSRSVDSDRPELTMIYRMSLRELPSEGEVSGSFRSPSDWESEASTGGSHGI